MKMNKIALVAVVAMLCLCVGAQAFGHDLFTLHAAAMAAGPLLTVSPLTEGVRREFGRKDTGAADDNNPVAKELARISDQVKEFCETNKDAIQNAGTLSKQAKEKVDELLAKQGELTTRLQELEQKAAKGFKAPGDMVDENSVGFALQKAFDEGKLTDFINSHDKKAHLNIPISRRSLTNTGTTGTALSYPGQQILATPLPPLLRRLTIRDLLLKGRTGKSLIWYRRESGYTNNAAVVSEGSLKPTSEITFEVITETVKTIAHLQDISLQMLDDVEFLESYVTGRMYYSLALVEEGELLTGSGTGQHLEGIYTAATAYAAPSGAIIAGTSSETDLDKLRLALLQVELANAGVTGIVLHPTDWANIELLKDTQGHYMFANPQAITTPRLWGRDVVPSLAMTQGTFLVGDFAAHAQIFDRQDANVAISFENNDNFARNMATLRVEERLALAIYRPEAFVKGVLESAS